MSNDEQPALKARILTPFRALVVLAAVFCILQFCFAVFGIPRGVVHWLKCGDLPRHKDPEWILVLGGSGIPSATSLMRSYFGAQCALANPRARCIVALPSANDTPDSSSERMRNELVIRGVHPRRIETETRGMNTHEQAENIARMLGPQGRRSPVVVVSSPYHLRRAYLCFKKAGFDDVSVLASHNVSSEADYGKAMEAWSGIGGLRAFVGHFRYGFWINLTAEVWITRELIGLAVYKARGWI